MSIKKYRVLLDPLKMVIVKRHWPHTKIGRKGVVTGQASAELAIHEVADEAGISEWLLKAVQIRGRP